MFIWVVFNYGLEGVGFGGVGVGEGEGCWVGFGVIGFVGRVGGVGLVCLGCGGCSGYLSIGDGSGWDTCGATTSSTFFSSTWFTGGFIGTTGAVGLDF